MPALLVWLPIVVLSGFVAAPAAAPVPPARSEAHRFQRVIDELRRALRISAEVAAAIVDSNPLVVSVEPSAEHEYVMSAEAGFLTHLDDDELRAVVAHELGHVWIFTHHPYLQTERSANRIAMRVVSRDTLLRVYEKVWALRAIKGDVARVLGQ